MADRELQPTRDPIMRTSGVVEQAFNNRDVSEIRPSIFTRDNGRVFSDEPPQNAVTIDYTELNSRILNSASKLVQVPWNPEIIAQQQAQANQTAVTSPAQPGTFYGTGDPFLVLADVFRNVLGSGGDASQDKGTGQALVPVTSSSGGGSPIVLIVILLVVGVGGYYLYKKYKSNA